MEALVESFLERIRGANSSEAVHGAFAEVTRSLGFDKFTYLNMKISSGYGGTPLVFRTTPFCLTTFPEEWQRYYHENNCHEHDPVLKEGIDNILPVTWDDVLIRKPVSAEARELMGTASEFALPRGLCVPIHGPSGEMGLVNVVSTEPEREFKALTRAYGHALHLMAIHLHANVRHLVTDDELPYESIHLSRRETECLLWTAEGKTVWEISCILNISEATVNDYLKRSMKKLGVFNKTHAVAKMLALGMVPL